MLHAQAIDVSVPYDGICVPNRSKRCKLIHHIYAKKGSGRFAVMPAPHRQQQALSHADTLQPDHCRASKMTRNHGTCEVGFGGSHVRTASHASPPASPKRRVMVEANQSVESACLRRPLPCCCCRLRSAPVNSASGVSSAALSWRAAEGGPIRGCQSGI